MLFGNLPYFYDNRFMFLASISATNVLDFQTHILRDAHASVGHIPNMSEDASMCSSSAPPLCIGSDNRPTPRSVGTPLNKIFRLIFVY